MNLSYGRRCLQIIFWLHPSDIREYWAFKSWRWPDEKTRAEAATVADWENFGFRALSLGPIEFRYWKIAP